jgi:multiple sugar transport system ATP-binding protein
MNILEGSLAHSNGTLVCRVGSADLPLPDARPALEGAVGKPIAVGIRPEALDLAGDGQRPTIRGRVEAVEALGAEQLAHVSVEGRPVLVEDVLEGLVDADEAKELAELMTDERRATVVARLDASAPVRPDDAIELAVNVNRLHFFDIDSGEAIGA